MHNYAVLVKKNIIKKEDVQVKFTTKILMAAKSVFS